MTRTTPHWQHWLGKAAWAALGLLASFGTEAKAQWNFPTADPYHTDEPLFVAASFEDPSHVWEYGSSSIMPVVALLQEPAPLPPPMPSLTDPVPTEIVPSQVRDDQQYGEELEDFNIQFLRTASVLLQPGQWQMDLGLAYAKDDYDFPITVAPSGVARANIRRRTLQVPFALRYGLTDRIQLSGSLPIGWSHQEYSSLGLFDDTSSKGGIGDLELGVNLLCREGCYGYSPDVILSFGLTMPTGDAEFPTTGISQASLANGVWAPSVQLLAIQRYDPIIYFYGVGYRYQAKREFGDRDVFFGHQITYNFGVGFAVNDRITLSTAFLGLYQSETQIDGVGVPGSMREPLRLRFAATTYRCGRIVEPFAEIGMTEDAADAVVGIVWTL
ncbi:hypothetical protein AB1L30_05620 [Bremerella sp. JC817]|uniref:hypothetical protein n=1 Tax=Bremerella sp. JC817 TaxID=3231756 RepID=UPI003458D17B